MKRCGGVEPPGGQRGVQPPGGQRGVQPPGGQRGVNMAYSFKSSQVSQIKIAKKCLTSFGTTTSSNVMPLVSDARCPMFHSCNNIHS